MIERGVRFVQVWSGASGARNNWDNHADIPKELPAIAQQVDQPTAALLKDLQARGLLEDTLVIWTTEFGRMPFTQGCRRPRSQRRHVRHLAGRGRRQGGRALRRRATSSAIRRAEDKTIATTCTPPCCT